MQHYYAVAECGEGAWWISFPNRDGLTSAADDAEQVIAAGQEALASAAMNGGNLPRSIEDGALPPDDLSDFGPSAVVVVIPFLAAGTRRAA